MRPVRPSRRAVWVVSGLVLLAAGLVVFLGGDGWEIADQKASVLGMLAEVGALLLVVGQELRSRRGRVVDLDQLAAHPAELVSSALVNHSTSAG